MLVFSTFLHNEFCPRIVVLQKRQEHQPRAGGRKGDQLPVQAGKGRQRLQPVNLRGGVAQQRVEVSSADMGYVFRERMLTSYSTL